MAPVISCHGTCHKLSWHLPSLIHAITCHVHVDRYSHEQPFTGLNIDIRNQQHLKESLEQYVKGDLLEGANAYFCERCQKKVDTVKRMCIKRLPRMLPIQLKRFDYDWERECPIKFNDYFEFPREIDMEPYTVYGMAKMEGGYLYVSLYV